VKLDLVPGERSVDRQARGFQHRFDPRVTIQQRPLQIADRRPGGEVNDNVGLTRDVLGRTEEKDLHPHAV
jgi:hypothetical protein